MRMLEKAVGNDAHEFVLDLTRGFARGDCEPVGEAKDVRVDSERRLAERRVHDDVRSLAADTGQSLQRLRSRGVSPPCLSMIARERAMMFLAFVR